MPVRNSLWKVGESPQVLRESKLPDEHTLEKMIVASPGILSDEWMLIGEQVHTAFGGFVDLLAIAPDGGLVVIELKRDKTPREVVAQALDYASWVQTLEASDVADIYATFSPGGTLADAFQRRFVQPLDEDTINQSHQIVVVAAALDASTERIVNYLNGRDVPVNVVFFQVFGNGNEQLLSRTWMIDPGETQLNAALHNPAGSEPWNGEFYVSYGDGASRNWDEARKYGFISGGGGTWYSNTLSALSPGDRVWVKVPGQGFVGVGRVTGPRQSATDFRIGDRPALEMLKNADYQRESKDDPDLCEYFVPVKWLETLPLDKAFNEVGLFGNQNTVCKPTAQKWRATIDRLKKVFRKYDADVLERPAGG